MSIQTAPSALEVQIREVPPQTYLGKRLHVVIPGDVGTPVSQAYAELFSRLAAANVAPSGPPFLIATHPVEGGMDVLVGVPCAEAPAAAGLVSGTLPGGRVAVTTHRGSYESLAPVYAALSGWILTNGHVMAGPPREVYLTGPEVPQEQHVTEVFWPIA